MIDLAFWTDLAIGTLVVLPLVVFGLFLRDAAALLREIKEARETTAPLPPPLGPPRR